MFPPSVPRVTAGISHTLNMNHKDIEDSIMAHRYLYYCLGEPTVSDFVYDQLEREARAVLPKESPVQGVGSSLSASYTNDQINLAHIRAGY